ncbi:glutathione synthase/RimK-type ligase-like ATP-grasp enzyme [Catalinimonas alkaloidigena]|uniref:ATP-grasp domain-containing protein n=1 Tax=Catalinimonas alkaloidigena TaxID=1075417 RepID=UPI002406BE04|nr:hypothetical protein [Catalinimonas alkaloidigena]MDF9799233.1 glutathione synthase/RimK-type ligase-like ATP-grasp enzyme [Catalinimonas alkaloidigena]
MSRFFCIYNSVYTDSLDLKERLDSLKGGCNFHSIEFVEIDEDFVDFSTLPIPNSNDGLYNCARGSFITERLMLNENVKTFYRNYEVLSQKDDSNILTIELQKKNIPTPKTIYKGTNNRNLLNKYVDFLDGFPLIVKTYGGVSGVGVIRIDSYSSLFSITDFLVKKNEDFQIKQFIKSNSCERVTVLGDKVLYSITRPIKEQEFRSDGYSKSVRKVELGSKINEIAIKAAHASNLNFAGIDIIVDRKNKEAYVLEVNLPHNFVQHEKITGEKYSREMIGWMFNK